MKLVKAVRTKNKKAVQDIVAKAVKVYNSEVPEAKRANTVFGDMDVRSLDGKSKWQIATSELAGIMRAVEYIPSEADNKVETAKIIATSQLRILFEDFESDNDFL